MPSSVLARAAAGASACIARAAALPGGARRAAGDLPVKSNPHVEAGGTSREHIEEGFRFDGAAFRRAVLWIVAFPAALYFGVTSEFAKSDALAGKPARHVMGVERKA